MLSFKTTMGTIVVPGGFCFLVPFFILKATLPQLPSSISLVHILAGLVVACGLSMVLWVSIVFVRKGQGTPIPVDPPTRLVVQGLFRFVRNPMYVGAVLIVLGEALFFRSGWLLLYTVGLWSVLHTFLVVFEEPQLKQRFGPDFVEYMNIVPRWIPRIPAPGIPEGNKLNE